MLFFVYSDAFIPNAGFWCGNNPTGQYHVPSGLKFTQKILPNSPYANISGAIVQTWRPNHWASWMFEIGDYDAGNMQFQFSRGGFQGARFAMYCILAFVY